MKISRKMKQAINEAIDAAASQVVTANAPLCDEVPPENWSKEEKAVFDQAYEVAYRAKEKASALFE